MRHLLLFAHIFGSVLWLGGTLAAMGTGMLMQRLARSELGIAMKVQAWLMMGMTLPGTLLVVISGLILTLRLYGSATSVGGFPLALMIMQGAGLLAAALILVVTLPTVTRLTRLDPGGVHAPLFDALRGRMKLMGMVTGALAFVALVAGVLLN